MLRPQLTDEQAMLASNVVMNRLWERVANRGWGSYASRHEILGILEEEHHELKEAVWKGDLDSVRAELIDYAVGAIWAIAGIDSGAITERSK